MNASTLTPETCRIIIGVDEAGYGPNIGPLVIAASAWSAPLTMQPTEQLAQALPTIFQPKAYRPGCPHVPLGDSKQLYTPSQGLHTLEAGLLACLSQIPSLSPTLATGFHQFLNELLLPHTITTQPPQAVWYDRISQDLPYAVMAEEVSRLSQLARQSLNQSAVQLLAARALVINEADFNRQLEQLGSKGRLLSTATMILVRELIEQFPGYSLEIFCDRQGGRKKYTTVLMEGLSDDWFDTLAETATRSSYQRQRLPSVRVHFSVQGDQFPPTGLASMTAKYVRERLMAAINAYWQSQVPDLKPTAGYPVDAKRFRQAIESKADSLGYALTDWWRVC